MNPSPSRRHKKPQSRRSRKPKHPRGPRSSPSSTSTPQKPSSPSQKVKRSSPKLVSDIHPETPSSPTKSAKKVIRRVRRVRRVGAPVSRQTDLKSKSTGVKKPTGIKKPLGRSTKTGLSTSPKPKPKTPNSPTSVNRTASSPSLKRKHRTPPSNRRPTIGKPNRKPLQSPNLSEVSKPLSKPSSLNNMRSNKPAIHSNTSSSSPRRTKIPTPSSPTGKRASKPLPKPGSKKRLIKPQDGAAGKSKSSPIESKLVPNHQMDQMESDSSDDSSEDESYIKPLPSLDNVDKSSPLFDSSNKDLVDTSSDDDDQSDGDTVRSSTAPSASSTTSALSTSTSNHSTDDIPPPPPPSSSQVQPETVQPETIEFNPKYIRKQGYLTKQGYQRKNWKERWCILYNNRLEYYKDQDGDLKGTIPLDGCSVFTSGEKTGKGFSFEIFHPARRCFQLIAEDQHDLRDWIKNVKQSIKVYRDYSKATGGNFVPVKTIAQRISGLKFQLDNPSRSFIQEGIMVKISKGKAQERHFFLFNDILLYGVRKKTTIVYKDHLPLSIILIREVSDLKHVGRVDLSKSFELVRADKKKIVVICCRSKAEKVHWYSAIEEQQHLLNNPFGNSLKRTNSSLFDSSDSGNSPTTSTTAAATATATAVGRAVTGVSSSHDPLKTAADFNLWKSDHSIALKCFPFPETLAEIESWDLEQKFMFQHNVNLILNRKLDKRSQKVVKHSHTGESLATFCKEHIDKFLEQAQSVAPTVEISVSNSSTPLGGASISTRLPPSWALQAAHKKMFTFAAPDYDSFCNNAYQSIIDLLLSFQGSKVKSSLLSSETSQSIVEGTMLLYHMSLIRHCAIKIAESLTLILTLLLQPPPSTVWPLMGLCKNILKFCPKVFAQTIVQFSKSHVLEYPFEMFSSLLFQFPQDPQISRSVVYFFNTLLSTVEILQVLPKPQLRQSLLDCGIVNLLLDKTYQSSLQQMYLSSDIFQDQIENSFQTLFKDLDPNSSIDFSANSFDLRVSVYGNQFFTLKCYWFEPLNTALDRFISKYAYQTPLKHLFQYHNEQCIVPHWDQLTLPLIGFCLTKDSIRTFGTVSKVMSTHSPSGSYVAMHPWRWHETEYLPWARRFQRFKSNLVKYKLKLAINAWPVEFRVNFGLIPLNHLGGNDPAMYRSILINPCESVSRVAGFLANLGKYPSADTWGLAVISKTSGKEEYVWLDQDSPVISNITPSLPIFVHHRPFPFSIYSIPQSDTVPTDPSSISSIQPVKVNLSLQDSVSVCISTILHSVSTLKPNRYKLFFQGKALKLSSNLTSQGVTAGSHLCIQVSKLTVGELVPFWDQSSWFCANGKPYNPLKIGSVFYEDNGTTNSTLQQTEIDDEDSKVIVVPDQYFLLKPEDAGVLPPTQPDPLPESIDDSLVLYHNLKSAPLPTLVQILLNEERFHPLTVHAFLMINAPDDVFFTYFQQRLELPECPQFWTNEEYSKRVETIVLNSIRVLEILLTFYPHKSTMSGCNSQIKTILTKSLQLLIQKYSLKHREYYQYQISRLANMVTQLDNSSELHNRTVRRKRNLQSTAAPPKPKCPSKWINCSDNAARTFSLKISFADIDELEFARQLTLINCNLFSSIDFTEFLSTRWAGKQAQEYSSNLLEAISNFNKTSNWVATEILSHPKSKMRAKIIAKFLQVCDHCFKLGNFNTVMAILGGLSNNAVHRLSDSFNSVSSKFLAIQEELDLLMSTKSSYRRYRVTLSQTKPPIIPFLGAYMTDLTFIEDGNSDFVQGDLFNFGKSRKNFDILAQIMYFQRTCTYNFSRIDPIRYFIDRIKYLDDESLYQKSLLYEPRE